MNRILAALSILLAACATSPSPTPQPTPAATVSPSPMPGAKEAAPPTFANAPERYTLTGIIQSVNECGIQFPSAMLLSVTLANAQHSFPSGNRSVGMMGRSYLVNIDWNPAWGEPTEWRDMKIVRWDKTPFCSGSCSTGGGGSCQDAFELVTIPATGLDTRHDLVMRCACAAK